MSIETLLKTVQKTNPQMTKEKLIEELQKSTYSALCLALVCENEEKAKTRHLR